MVICLLSVVVLNNSDVGSLFLKIICKLKVCFWCLMGFGGKIKVILLIIINFFVLY